jgi:hypothetical protein
MNQPDQLLAAQAYLGRGWRPLPILLGEKGPRSRAVASPPRQRTTPM